ncbi:MULTISPECIES: cell wall-binding protein [Lysinibacillus]|uniref:cell wall-binding protein n=1 Tax=Lysinibacillus TaxID=400634 RepID=UPI001F51CF28|nr:MULTISPECIES: cell wall-binding protein [Lysinibacillus]
MVRLNRKLTAGVITSLLLAPTAIANAQENDAQSRVSTQTEQVANVNGVAAATTREQMIAQFAKLSENSTADEMVIAKGDVAILSKTDFTNEEIAFIQAKYDYVVEQRNLISELTKIGKSISAVTYTNKTFIDDVAAVGKTYETFLGSYLDVQKEFETAVNLALKNGASNIASTIRGTSLQYGYDEAARNAYFKAKGADIAKLLKLEEDAGAASTATVKLDAFVDILKQNPNDYAAISAALENVTTAYNALTADQKKVVVAYNPNNDSETPYKKYTDALTNMSSVNKVALSITQLKAKQPADFTSATNFISAVTAIETAYTKLGVDSQKLVTNYQDLQPFKEAADISKQITALRISSDDSYRTAVDTLKASYDNLSINKGYVKNGADLEIAAANIASAREIEGLITKIKGETDKVAAINAARAAYNTPPASNGSTINAANVKKIVNNLAELTNWEKIYSASLSVDKLIDSLDPKSSTFESKTLAAQAAFDKLGESEKALVQKKDKLDLFFQYADLSKKVNALNSSMKDYKAQIVELQTKVTELDAGSSSDATALKEIKNKLETKLSQLADEETAVEAVRNQIDNLSKSNNLVVDMLKARSDYNALPAAAKKHVTNIKILTDLEKSHRAVINVIDQFEKLDPASKNYISKAKSAYTAYAKLDETNREYVRNYKELNDVVAVTEVIVQINALNPSQKTYKDNVAKANEAFNTLAKSLQEKVVNAGELKKAQGYIDTAKAFDDRVLALANEHPDTFVAKVAALSVEYKTMDKNAKKLVEQAKTLTNYEKNNKAVVKVIQMIDALNPTSKDYTKKVLAARKAYNALDEVSQKRVTNYANLTAVEDVASLIGLISSLKPSSKTFYQDMKTAREMYDALPPEKQQVIINYDALVAAENEQGVAHKVVELIDLTKEQGADYLTKLMNARVAYDELTANQKKLVTNIKDLTAREKAVKPILNVMVQINNLDPESNNFVSKVNSARKAYDNLNKDQKKYVNNFDILQTYEPVSKVIELISKLKSSSSTYLEDTTRARSLYDALPADMKQYVTNYYLLQAAETSILGAGNVMQMINDLPSVDPKQYVKRIQEIRAAYNALPKDQQRAVQNYKVLQDQEKLLKPVISVVEDIDRLLTAKDMNSQYQKILKAYDKLNAEQRRYVYNDDLLLSLDNVIKVYKNIASLNPKDKFYFGMVEAVRKEYDSLNTTDKQRITNYSILLEAEKSMADVKKVVELIAGLSPTSSTYIEDVANAVAAYKALDSKLRGQVINEDVLKKAEKDVQAVLKVVEAIAVIDPDNSSFEKKVLAAQKLYSSLTLEQQDLVYNYRILEEYLKMLE